MRPSNSALAMAPKDSPNSRPLLWFGTGGPGGASVYRLISNNGRGAAGAVIASWERVPVPLAGANSSSGVFSLSFPDGVHGVAVGGDYQSANQSSGTAAVSSDGGKNWQAAQSLPAGYRSSVAYDAGARLWIAVGPNGTDLSLDGGKNWRPLKPSATDPRDADQSWNALSLPFVVGPHGRIGRLRTVDQTAKKP
ncbi:hypothetical protein [Granulicella sp. S190]|uniref:WD40/YVTN/BNR-like repeat-containing protein n=1 Tax=Granulicella sp. S190 TaxID=1747226 RepID=UPI00131B6926|nr:hypothetical protein [Granulicella sp. S190]